MKKIIFAFLFAAPCFAWNGRTVAITALPTTYSTNAQSLILSDLPRYDKNIVFLTTVSGVACRAGATSVTAPATIPNGNQQEVYLIASEHVYLKDVSAVANIYCRSTTGGGITNGQLSISTW